MKAKELMLGDFITLADSLEYDKEPLIFKVVCLGYDGEETALVLLNGEKACDIVEIDDDWCGIPIIPEILEKNGFTNVGTKVWQWEEKPFWVWWEEETHHLGIEIDDSSYDDEKSKTIMIIVQNYVHELQHALRLCGIEKEIEL